VPAVVLMVIGGKMPEGAAGSVLCRTLLAWLDDLHLSQGSRWSLGIRWQRDVELLHRNLAGAAWFRDGIHY
jgi:hypothetical protein